MMFLNILESIHILLKVMEMGSYKKQEIFGLPFSGKVGKWEVIKAKNSKYEYVRF